MLSGTFSRVKPQNISHIQCQFSFIHLKRAPNLSPYGAAAAFFRNLITLNLKVIVHSYKIPGDTPSLDRMVR